MDVRVNIIEVASALAEQDVVAEFPYPNEIYVENEDGDTHYTDEAQEFFNERYDIWWDFLWEFKSDDDNE